MRPVRVAIPGSGDGGESAVVPLDIYQTGPVTLAIDEVDAGTVDVDLQFTFGDVWDPNATLTWIDLTTGETGNGAFPLVDANGDRIMATGVRATNAGADPARLVVIQQGTDR